MRNEARKTTTFRDERGSAIVISLFVLALMTAFVALALSRSSAEAAAVGTETAEGRTFYAAQGSLETMTRNFNKVFEVKLSPSSTDLGIVRSNLPVGITGYNFNQELPFKTSDSNNVVLNGGPYTGLYAIRDSWRLRTTATNSLGIQVQLTRDVLNNRVPIFQFGIFYEDDLELYRPPLFAFGGRVHSNRHFFISPGGAGVYFNSRVTAVGHIVTQSWRNGFTGDSGNNQTYIKNASAVDRQLLPEQGSVLNTTAGAADNIFASNPDLPPSRLNPSFATQSAIFDGNLKAQVDRLNLPLSIGATTTNLIEMIKRGKKMPDTNGGDLNTGGTAAVTAATQDNDILRAERFANKTGIRVSLADSKAKLPGCATSAGSAVTGNCGVRLDGDVNGNGADPDTAHTVPAFRSRGYQPRLMKGSSGGLFDYVPTRLNGERFYNAGRQMWIKVETVSTNPTTNAIETKDITQDILSLGVTEQPAPDSGIDIHRRILLDGTSSDGYTETPPSSTLNDTAPQAPSTGTDSRSILKLQRFAIRGPAIADASNVMYSYGSGTSAMTVVRRYAGVSDPEIVAGCIAACTPSNNDIRSTLERYGHLHRATVNGVANEGIVAFPIEMFDSREGQHYDERSTTYYDDLSRVAHNGVMSMIDIDIANLRRFLRGDFNGCFPTNTPFATSNGGVGLRNTDIPEKDGWVLYVSDRRGDADFDGEYDMEDVYGANKGNDGVLQPGEDANGNGVLDVLYGTESERYNDLEIEPNEAAVYDHKYFRRGVRLVNGTVVPGVYDATTAANTRGFTVASENGVYVLGNYNATNVASTSSTGNTPYNDYRPFDTQFHIPASIVADGITILSNAWNDGQSFAFPYDQSQRLASETTIRFAMIAGDTIPSKEATPHQGGISPRLNGGVHNFKRFLERWTNPSDASFSVRLNYAGSLINLFNSRGNIGSFKCCNTVYNPPVRNWVFDSTFLNPERLPPGTPYFQYVQTTGFQRTNE
jgi:hypothetical protein